MPFGVLRALTNFKPVEVKIGMRMTGNSGGAAGAASERSPFPGAESIFSGAWSENSGRNSGRSSGRGVEAPCSVAWPSPSSRAPEGRGDPEAARRSTSGRIAASSRIIPGSQPGNRESLATTSVQASASGSTRPGAESIFSAACGEFGRENSGRLSGRGGVETPGSVAWPSPSSRAPEGRGDPEAAGRSTSGWIAASPGSSGRSRGSLAAPAAPASASASKDPGAESIFSTACG